MEMTETKLWFLEVMIIFQGALFAKCLMLIKNVFVSKKRKSGRFVNEES